jgi:putative membrane protein
MALIRQLLIGIVIGGGMILPGVSGGVLAVIFGIYEQLLDSVSHFFNNVKKNIRFLTPLLIGLIIGVLIFGKILFFVFDKYPMESKFTFIGLILGGLPILFKETERKGDKKVHLPVLILSFLIAITLFVLGKGTFDFDFSSNINEGFLSIFLLFLTGVIFIAGKIIPGISSSFLLMLIGMYQYLLNILNDPLALTNEQYLQLVPIVLGMVIGGIFLINIIQLVIKKHFSITYSVIIGFVIGSIAAIYPGFSFDVHGFVGVLLLLVSFLIVYKCTLAGHNNSNDDKSIDN